MRLGTSKTIWLLLGLILTLTVFILWMQAFAEQTFSSTLLRTEESRIYSAWQIHDYPGFIYFLFYLIAFLGATMVTFIMYRIAHQNKTRADNDIPEQEQLLIDRSSIDFRFPPKQE